MVQVCFHLWQLSLDIHQVIERASEQAQQFGTVGIVVGIALAVTLALALGVVVGIALAVTLALALGTAGRPARCVRALFGSILSATLLSNPTSTEDSSAKKKTYFHLLHVVCLPPAAPSTPWQRALPSGSSCRRPWKRPRQTGPLCLGSSSPSINR
jgi:hypothetical protein